MLEETLLENKELHTSRARLAFLIGHLLGTLHQVKMLLEVTELEPELASAIRNAIDEVTEIADPILREEFYNNPIHVELSTTAKKESEA